MPSARENQDYQAIVAEIGEVGLRMAQLNAAEGSAGNISVFARRISSVHQHLQEQGAIQLPVEAPDLAGGWLVVSGSGQRLRDLAHSPHTTLCVLNVAEGGLRAVLYAARGLRPTSEFNTHLAIHQDQVARRNLETHAIVHAQPPYLTYLSHLDPYADTLGLNRRLLRWSTESIAIFPEGIGVVPLQVPGSAGLMAASWEAMRLHRAIVWRRHGILTRSDQDVRQAGDLVEYAETAAHYETLNLQLGEPGQGIPPQDIRRICAALNIDQPFF